MEYLDVYLVKDRKERGFRLPFCRGPERFADRDDETEIVFWLLPERWLNRPRRLERRLLRAARSRPPRGPVWYEDRLLRALAAKRAGRRGGFGENGGSGENGGFGENRDFGETLGEREPGLFWMSRFYREQPFRENMVILLPAPEPGESGRLPLRQERWVEELAGEKSGRLNSLLLVSPVFSEKAGSVPLMEDGSWFERIYQETGLPSAGAGRLPEYYRNRMPGSTVCIDACRGGTVPFRSLPERTLYLDLTSEAGKERLLYAKRRDVSYVSLRMYLDTYVRKRYNTNRCKREEKRPSASAVRGFRSYEEERE